MDPVRSSEAPAPAAAEALLREAPEIELLGLLRHSSNYTFLARLGTDDPVLAVYKPAAGESPLWDFPAGTLYRREVAAYRLSRFLGWPAIPPTVVRGDAPHGVGALQLFVDADPSRHYLAANGAPARAWQPVALFDYLVNNADRKSGHCLYGRDGRHWAIDHGLTFHTDPKLRTVIWEFAGRRPERRLRGGLERAAAALAGGGPLEAELRELVSGREVAALRERVETAAAPGWTFPEPTSGWSVPWPPV